MNQSFAASKSILENVPTLVHTDSFQPDIFVRRCLWIPCWSSLTTRSILFILFIDHKPLTFALFRTSPPWSTMQQRRLSFLSEFNSEIRHLPGPENVVADALSCPEISNVPQHPQHPLSTNTTTLISELQPTPPPPVPGVSFSKMSLLQQSCPKVEVLLCSSTLSVISVPCSGSNLLCDMSTGILCPLVLEKMRRTVFELYHNISHPGIHAS